MTRALYVCLATILVAGAVFVTGCTSEPVTTTSTITTTATTTETETLPPETLTETTKVTETTTTTPQPTVPNQIAKDINVAEASNMVQGNIDNPEFIILDVRSAEEYAAAHIEDSALIDIHNSDTWLATVAALDKSYTYLIY